MTAIAVLATVRERLSHLLTVNKESSLVQEFEPLFSDLDKIEKLLLNNPVNLKYKDKTNTSIAEKVVQLAYEVEDAVESSILQENSSSLKGKTGGIKRGLLKLASSKSHHDDSQSIKLKIDQLFKLCESDAAREIGQKAAGISSSGGGAATDSRSSDEAPENTEEEIDDFEKLRWILMNDDDRYPSPAIWISGTKGIGKSTLARKLYDDPSVVMHFDSRAWAHVGQDFQARDIAASILANLSSLGNTKEEISRMETTQLMENVYKAQKGKKCLVVLDDVCSPDAWDTIRFAFPLDAGTRILITTGIRQVVEQVNGYIHHLKMLSKDQSWELLKNEAQVQDPEIEEIGKQIASLCQGMPLALSVVGAMLRGKPLEDWRETQNSLQQIRNSAHENISDSSLYNILDLSFKNLPLHLKPCFLYLGHFPPGQLIPVEKLYLLWMAEGLASTMDIAEGYLSELAESKLVTVQNEDYSGSGKFKSCELHDLIEDFCRTRGKEQGFLEVVGFSHGSDREIYLLRRAAIYLDAYKGKEDYRLIFSEPKNIRSLMFFNRDAASSKSIWPSEVSDLKEFRRTKVLNFYGVDFRGRKLPKGIEKLLYLRHLSFRGCYLEELPSSLSNFPLLETLDLFTIDSCQMTIPNVLKNIPSLRHLYFPPLFQSATDEKLKLDTLTKLQILENFHAGICDADDLQKLENLQIFKAISDGKNADIQKIINFIHGNKQLKHSSLEIMNFDCYSEERRSILSELLLKCDGLHALNIEGHLGVLPEMGSNFIELVFKGSEFSENPMPILGKLPNLRSLVLCHDAIARKEIVCSEGDFAKLKYLKLSGFWYLENWVVDSGSMPCLSSLTIEKCNKLLELPTELMDIPTLQEVKICDMPKGFEKSVRVLAKEQRDQGNVVLRVTFY